MIIDGQQEQGISPAMFFMDLQRPGFPRKVHHGCKPLFEVARWTPITMANVTSYRHWGCKSKYGHTQVDEWILLHWGCLSKVILNLNFGNSLFIRVSADVAMGCWLQSSWLRPSVQHFRTPNCGSNFSELSLWVDSGVFTHLSDMIAVCAAKSHFQPWCWDEEMQEESVPKHVCLKLP